jgi:hypothetical protein
MTYLRWNSVLASSRVNPCNWLSARSTASLVNPANDAHAMDDALRGLGFTVVNLRDGQNEPIIATSPNACDKMYPPYPHF